MTTVAIIQARTGSTRFPAKVLADLAGRTVLAHVIERVRRSRGVDDVVVATTTAPEDDVLVDLCAGLGVATVRGSVNDVLGRYVLAARRHSADVIVRITADCPLLDSRLIDRVIGALSRAKAEYASNIMPPTYPDGYDVEALTSECLSGLDAAAGLPYEREHVTVRIREHTEQYRTAEVRCRRDLSAIRLTVDVPGDLARIRRILASIPGRAFPGLGAVLAVLDRDPELSMEIGLPSRDESYHAQRRAALLEGSA